MRAIQLDRWLLNHVFQKRRVFTVRLDQCFSEFGGRYGKDQRHFLVRALEAGPDRSSMEAVLREHYDGNPIKSFNEMIEGDIGDPAGECYFLPWESGRIRPLSRFLNSHKVGPTPDEALGPILDRLTRVLESIRRKGFRQVWRWDGYVRLINVVNSEQQNIQIVRDGNHRMASLSFLGQTCVKACWESDHWENPTFFRSFAKLLGKAVSTISTDASIREAEAEQWPHVQSGLVTAEEAQRCFRQKFSKAFGS